MNGDMEWGVSAMMMASNLVIGLSYLAIPLALFSIVRHWPPPHLQWMFWLFMAFIAGCGLTHLLSVVWVFRQDESLSVLMMIVHLVTALVSMVTAMLIWVFVTQCERVLREVLGSADAHV